MKILSVVGARPQFIKCSPVSREIRKSAREVLVHTGQHYDDNMSEAFFRELDIPKPDHNLGVGSGPHGRQTAEMLSRLEEVMMKEKPDAVLVYGDTNSTIAGALAAAKLHIPLGHVEAGLRSFNRLMPEEVNRLVVDRVSGMLFCPTRAAVENLGKEGVTDGVHLVGDVMRDALLQNAARVSEEQGPLQGLGVEAGGYALATVHRAENTDDEARLAGIVTALEELGARLPVVWPVHPRAKAALEKLGRYPRKGGNLRAIDPVPYLKMIALEKNARLILTDSGGVQKEAYWLKVPCVTLRDETEWVELVESGWNRLAGAAAKRIVEAAGKASSSAPGGRVAELDIQGASATIARLLSAGTAA